MNAMIRITTLAGLLAGFTLTATQAQDRLSPDEALHYAEMVGSVQAQLKSAPGAATVDLKQPVAVRDGEYGLMLLPATKLSAEALAQAGTEVVPVGQLWLLKLAPLADGQVVANDRLQMVTVSGGEGSATLPCCNLGVRKAAGGGLELVVFGKGKEPILQAPLKAITGKQTSPLEIEVERESDRGRVTVKVAGKYAANFAVTDPELF
jgi:hypothetical protein